MKNRWKASVTNENNTEEEQPKNNSKKIGIAMGIVGALLVTAGVVPMFFDGGEDLKGDLLPEETEAIDPLVALLSGGNNDSGVEMPKTTPTTKATLKPITTKSPSTTPIATKPTATIKPTPRKNTQKLTEVDKILAEEGEKVAENKNTGTNDTNGSAFGTAEELHSAAGLSNTSNIKTQPTPKTTVQTGNNTSLLLGFLFLIISGMISFTGMLRRKNS